MANAEAQYIHPEGLELKLFLDIDLKTEKIQDFYYKGTLSSIYNLELEELKSLILNRTYSEALFIKPEVLKNAVFLPHGKRPLATLSLWLTHKAIEDYLGNTHSLKLQNDLLCLCFGIEKKELKKEILNRSDYDLKEVIAETFASSACGSCLPQIIESLKNLREEHGLIKGLAHSQARLDKEGNWVKIKDMYPAELIIKLSSLKNFWMKREGIDNQFQIEIKNIEGYHIWLEVSPSEDIDRNAKVLSALSDYWRSEIGALFFLHLGF